MWCKQNGDQLWSLVKQAAWDVADAFLFSWLHHCWLRDDWKMTEYLIVDSESHLTQLFAFFILAADDRRPAFSGTPMSSKCLGRLVSPGPFPFYLPTSAQPANTLYITDLDSPRVHLPKYSCHGLANALWELGYLCLWIWQAFSVYALYARTCISDMCSTFHLSAHVVFVCNVTQPHFTLDHILSALLSSTTGVSYNKES